MKIVITSYFGIRDAIQSAVKQLEQIGYQVIDYPIFKYVSHVETKIPDPEKHFEQFLKKERPVGILWWCLPTETDCFFYIKEKIPNIRYWFFNWDEPFNWEHNTLNQKSKYFETVFVSCHETLNKYITNGCQKAVYCLPGYDEDFFYPLNSDGYDFDISIVLTNLYQDNNKYPNQIINRCSLVDCIYKGQKKYGYRFAIFGPDFLKNRYPSSYQGYCQYKEQNRVFNRSRINLTTHVIGDKAGYLNERTITIIGSGALILIDNVKSLEMNLIHNENCLILDTKDPVKQIVGILGNYSFFDIIKKNLSENNQKFRWKYWAKTIDDHIKYKKD